MKTGRYFNFLDICDRNLWDTGYLVKKLQGYGILRPPLPPNGASLKAKRKKFQVSSLLFRYSRKHKVLLKF